MRTCKNTNPFYKSFLIAIALTLSVSTSVLAAGKHRGVDLELVSRIHYK